MSPSLPSRRRIRARSTRRRPARSTHASPPPSDSMRPPRITPSQPEYHPTADAESSLKPTNARDFPGQPHHRSNGDMRAEPVRSPPPAPAKDPHPDRDTSAPASILAL